jgi:type II restriction enzyme
LGLDNDTKVIYNFFLNNLDESITMWNYYVDFSKVLSNIQEMERELALLNTLIGKNDLSKELIDLISAYPNVRKALPLLVALRIKQLNGIRILASDGVNKISNIHELFDPKIPLTRDITSKIIQFFYESGLDKIFEERTIKNVVDYSIGVEVGLDTNARKNRTGKIMESIVKKYLETISQLHPLQYLEQPTKRKLEDHWGIDIILDKSDRRFDFAVRNINSDKIVLIETNYYSSGGSKLKATAGEYKYLHNFLSQQNVTLVWITDGIGWNTTKRPLEETFLHNNYVFNLELMRRGALLEVLLS